MKFYAIRNDCYKDRIHGITLTLEQANKVCNKLNERAHADYMVYHVKEYEFDENGFCNVELPYEPIY